MLATAQSGSDFQVLNEVAKIAVRSALDGLEIETKTLELPPTPESEYKAFPNDIIAVVERGLVSTLHNDTVVSVLDRGDMLMPDTTFLPSTIPPLLYGSETGATLRTYDRKALLAALTKHPQRHNAWTEAVSLQSSLLLRLNALHIREAIGGEGSATEFFAAGSVIIQQGDPADDVFSMSEGTAEVLVNDISVAKIGTGELFGTMAALTGSHRNATIRALEPCEVVRVPKDRFFELIRSRPAAVQGLLVDMARSITELNEEVVRLRKALNG